MGTIRIRVADPLDDRQPPALEQVSRRPHRGVKADAVADFQKLLGREPKLAAVFRIGLVAERDDGVDAVIAAVELKHDEHSSVARG